VTAPHRTSRRPRQESAAPHHNLPAPHPRLVGREQDSSTVKGLVLQVPGRLVTLTGTGGCGKTQLALLVAAGLIDAFRDGAWLVELAPVQAAHLVPYAVATVLGRSDRADDPMIDTIVAFLKGRELLLVLDNCEHLIDACADLVERVLTGCPQVRLLATSRERLRLGAETTWRVPSLARPDRRTRHTPVDLLQYPAVRLFVERAQAVESDFTLAAGNASTVVDICARLEGLPLALELAAAQVSALALSQILERLDDSFRLLVGGSRTAPTRQQTLRATLDWSYGLLSAAEQAVFLRLAVFVGGWTLEAAEAVCADATVARADVLELLTRLVDKSLVVANVDTTDGRSRYRLLEPIRQYAQERLVAAGELDAVRARHAAFFLAFAEALERDASVGGARRQSAAAALEGEYRNLEAALRLALDTQDAELGLRLAWTLQYVWKIRLPVGAGRPWIEDVLALPGAEAPTPPRAVSLLTAARLAWERGDYDAADRYYAEAVPLARHLGDPWILFVALADQGLEAEQRGDYDQALTLWQEGLVVTRASGDRASEAILLMCLGRLHLFEGNYATGCELCEESLSLARQLGDQWVIWLTLHALGLAALARGDLASARALSAESLNLRGSSLMRTGTLYILGQVAIADGKYTEARQHLFQALALLEDIDDPVTMTQVVEALAQLASRLGQPDLALRLAGAVGAARDTLVGAVSRSLAMRSHFPLSRDVSDRWLVPLRRTVLAEDADRWWAEGRALSLSEAIALAESELPATVSTPEPPPGGAGLTAREADVLRLVARGQSNKEIAAELVLSVRTVERHITNLYGKIDARGKADATAYAIRHGFM
jgi:predicted ATPase/DNA-binding CsgD family transcriptional regulator